MDITACPAMPLHSPIQALFGRETSPALTQRRVRSNDLFSTTGPAAFELPVSTTSTEANTLLALELAAETGDEDAFLKSAATLDWAQMPAREIVRSAQLALRAGAPLCARRLATMGAFRYPHDTELARLARVLAPPCVIPRSTAHEAAQAANRRWLAEHADDYLGRWVAIQQGEILACADTLDGLREELHTERLPLPSDLLIKRVG